MTSFRLRHKAHRLLLKTVARVEPFVGGETTTLLGVGALVGVVTGGAAVLFVMFLDLLGSLVWSHSLVTHYEGPRHLMESAGLPAWWPLLVVPVGLLAVAWILRLSGQHVGGHGVPDVMYAVAEKDGRIRGRSGLLMMLTSSLTIGLGGSVGKEGPIAHIGSAFGSTIGQFLKVRRSQLPTLVGCGAAAGIAAMFNAPIGGVMFALEIVVGAYHLSSFTPIVLASVAGAVTARRFLGTEPVFDIPEVLREGLTIVTPWEFGAYVILGLLAGLLSLGFTLSVYKVEDSFDRWRAPWWIHALLAGLVVGALGMGWPQLLGEGHLFMTEVLSGSSTLPWTLLLSMVALKVLATTVTLGGGGAGGVFMPSVFIGAVFGAAFGQGMEALFPGQVAPTGAYALAGMAAVLAGTAHAPLTGILLLFEMSDNYLLILPLMTAAILSTAVASRLLPDSIYTLNLSRRGIVVGERRDTALLRKLRVSDAMQPPVDTVPEAAPFPDIVSRLLESDQHDFPVVDDHGHLMGALSLDDLREFLRNEHLTQILVARDCVRPIARLAPNSSLLEALDAFDKGTHYELPVVSYGRLVGSLRRQDVLTTYRRALLASTGQRLKRIKEPA